MPDYVTTKHDADYKLPMAILPAKHPHNAQTIMGHTRPWRIIVPLALRLKEAELYTILKQSSKESDNLETVLGTYSTPQLGYQRSILPRGNRNRQRKFLNKFQANKARRKSNHDLTLALAQAEYADIIII